MDGGVWQATDHAVTKSQTRLSDFIFTLDINKEGGSDRQERLIYTLPSGNSQFTEETR